MANIIIKRYQHFNRALPNWHNSQGRYISSKRQYEKEVREAGLISYEKAEEIRKHNEDKAKKNRKRYSKETLEFLGEIREGTDKKGKVKLSGRQIDYMIAKGAIKNRDIFADKLPKHYQPKGGFN